MGPAPAGQRNPLAGLGPSLALHAALLAAILLLPPRESLPVPVSHPGLDVEILSANAFAALTRPIPEPGPAQPRKPAIPPTAPNLEAAPGPAVAAVAPLAHAETILSDRALDRNARRSMESLASPARFEQLCNVEAIEQIARQRSGFRPERVIAYATADTSMEGDVLVAGGAVFLSGGMWHRLSFRCATTPDHRKVLSFDFATGGLIPDGPELGSGEAD